jgi:hypothetical protein
MNKISLEHPASDPTVTEVILGEKPAEEKEKKVKVNCGEKNDDTNETDAGGFWK